MDRSLCPVDRKPEAITRNHWQVADAAPPLGPESPPTLLEPSVLARVTFSGALNEAAKSSGKDDLTIADEIHISAGYMSRAMRGIWQAWAKRLVLFMRATNSRAPAQWIAHQVGCDLVVRSSREARIRELEQALVEARQTHQLA
jgi:hypothetical protein